jgi:hypothetical protein
VYLSQQRDHHRLQTGVKKTEINVFMEKQEELVYSLKKTVQLLKQQQKNHDKLLKQQQENHDKLLKQIQENHDKLLKQQQENYDKLLTLLITRMDTIINTLSLGKKTVDQHGKE